MRGIRGLAAVAGLVCGGSVAIGQVSEAVGTVVVEGGVGGGIGGGEVNQGIVTCVMSVWWGVHAIGVKDGGALFEGEKAEGMVRVMHWNVSSSSIDAEATGAWIGAHGVDVALVSNVRWDGDREALMGAMRGVVGDGEEEMLRGLSSARVRRIGRLVVMSRFEIVDLRLVYMNSSRVDGEGDREGIRETGDFGWACVVGVRAGGGGEVRWLWVVDLPSEPTVGRVGLMEDVVERMGGVEGVGGGGKGGAGGVVIGDFNTVRGSWSLGAFEGLIGGGGGGGVRDAGLGYGGTWKPVGWFGGLNGVVGGWGIDTALVGDGVEVGGYGLGVPDGGVWGEDVAHRAQVVDLKWE